MIKPEIREIIIKKLEALSKKHSIRILMAVESGSRAWGFPSTDSDYDVRFIYCRKPEEYINIYPSTEETLEEIPDHIEDTEDKLFDIVGWDIRKAFTLLLKGNVTPLEWASSGIEYIPYPNLTRTMFYLARFMNPYSVLRHHLSIASKTSKMALQPHTDYLLDNYVPTSYLINPKKMLYAIRSYLSCEWILDPYRSPVIPINILDLLTMKSITDDLKFLDAVNMLIAAKEGFGEKYDIRVSPILIDYCNESKAIFEALTESDVRDTNKYVQIDPKASFSYASRYIHSEVMMTVSPTSEVIFVNPS
jgi:predicted nucleotidyltransferase